MADGQAKSVCEKWMFTCTPGSREIRSLLLPGNSKMQVKCQGTDSASSESMWCIEKKYICKVLFFLSVSSPVYGCLIQLQTSACCDSVCS